MPNYQLAQVATGTGNNDHAQSPKYLANTPMHHLLDESEIILKTEIKKTATTMERLRSNSMVRCPQNDIYQYVCARSKMKHTIKSLKLRQFHMIRQA
jgi:hypothetical protein